MAAQGQSTWRVRAALAICLFIAVMEPVAWGMMLTSRSEIALAAMGLYSLKYFTVLSNLLLGIASLVYAVCLVRRMRAGARIPTWAHKLKFVATVAVGVTLATVMAFLGPMLGYAAMFAGANLWFHLVLPVLGIVEFVFLDVERGLKFGQTLLGVVPTFLYGLAYCGNIYLNGVGTWPATNDWYGFTMWGIEYIPVVFAVMLVATWLIAVVVRGGNALVRRQIRQKTGER